LIATGGHGQRGGYRCFAEQAAQSRRLAFLIGFLPDLGGECHPPHWDCAANGVVLSRAIETSLAIKREF